MSEEEGKKRQLSQEETVEELEIDVEAPEPLSKKQKRLLKKGKIDEKKHTADGKDLSASKDVAKAKETEQEKLEVKSKFAVWIGNLSFETSVDELKRFIIIKTAGADIKIEEDDITRINMPPKKGFAYVDFKTAEQMSACIGLSESSLNGRNLLIKDAKSFEGRPAKSSTASKNPPSRILFIGNLSFNTKEEDLHMQFQHCGEIIKVRMATFEDTGNCKGFAFVDFKEIEAATKAIGDKRCRRLDGRQLKLEYGEDRSKRTHQDKFKQNKPTETEAPVEQAEPAAPEHKEPPRPRHREPRQQKPTNSRGKPSPGLALATAQRAKTGIVASSGKKVVFD